MTDKNKKIIKERLVTIIKNEGNCDNIFDCIGCFVCQDAPKNWMDMGNEYYLWKKNKAVHLFIKTYGECALVEALL